MVIIKTQRSCFSQQSRAGQNSNTSMRAFIENVGLERWLSDWDYALLLQRTQPWILVSTLGSSQLPLTPALRRSDTSGLLGSSIHMPTQMHITETSKRLNSLLPSHSTDNLNNTVHGKYKGHLEEANSVHAKIRMSYKECPNVTKKYKMPLLCL